MSVFGIVSNALQDYFTDIPDAGRCEDAYQAGWHHDPSAFDGQPADCVQQFFNGWNFDSFDSHDLSPHDHSHVEQAHSGHDHASHAHDHGATSHDQGSGGFGGESF